jgi:hypothetical protein
VDGRAFLYLFHIHSVGGGVPSPHLVPLVLQQLSHIWLLRGHCAELSDRVQMPKKGADRDVAWKDSKVDEDFVLLSLTFIFRNYVFSVYFICDVVSSMPEIPELYDNDRYYMVARVFDFLALIKFVRITTYLEYSLRTFNVNIQSQC